jgi:endonuclease/exonuclease/phosphatase family metal-dependent hydrolase
VHVLASVALFVSVVLTQFTVAAEPLRISMDGAREGSASVENGASSLAAPEETLKVLTYNVQFRPAVADVSHPGWPNTPERAQAIGRAIAQYDMVALQEVFRPDRLNETLHAADTAGDMSGTSSQLPPAHLFDVATGPAPRRLSSPHASVLQSMFGSVTRTLYNILDAVRDDDQHAKPVENSGLVVLSRYPIVQRDWLTYHHKGGIDAWASKGVLHVVVQRGNVASTNNVLDVFITHLQAGGTAQQHERLAQVSELAQFIRTFHDATPERPVLVMGDFNIDGTPAQQEDEPSAYVRLSNALHWAIPTLTDVWLSHYGTEPGFTKRESPKRLDYIFATEGPQISSTTIQVNEFRCAPPLLTPGPKATNVYLSDHNGVEATLLWPHFS